MVNSVNVASQIRTNTGARLLRKISLAKMHNSLFDLFVDRTAIATSFKSPFNKDKIIKNLKYRHCLCLNDKRTIEYHKSCKQDFYVFDESRQIWYDSKINPIKDDLFIPRDDE